MKIHFITLWENALAIQYRSKHTSSKIVIDLQPSLIVNSIHITPLVNTFHVKNLVFFKGTIQVE